MGPLCGLSLWGGIDCPAPKWNLRKCSWFMSVLGTGAGECKKTIEVASARDHNQELYCKTCHARLFGPKGYGFAGGAGTILSMDTGKHGDVPTEYANWSYQLCHLLFLPRQKFEIL